MINSKGRMKGLVTVTVKDANGNVKYFKNTALCIKIWYNQA